MKIKSVRIRNFRVFADATIPFDNYTCLVGGNGAGKSTVLCALNVFFREKSNATDVQSLTEEDFHQRNTADRVEIAVTFHELSQAAKDDLRDYVRNDELIVAAVADFDPATRRAPVRQVGSRMGMAEFAPFFKGFESEKAAVLADMFRGYREQFPAIEAATNGPGRKAALIAFERENPNLLVQMESDDEFYGIAGNARLRAHVQWVYVPAVKDAADEQSETRDSALGRLLTRTVRAAVDFRTEIAALEETTRQHYNRLLEARQEALNQVGAALTRRLTEWCHPQAAVNLTWQGAQISIRDPAAKATGGEGEFSGELARFGHGFQRSYLMALLQELASTGAEDGPTLLLGCEEPELYQHPPQARYLSQVLQDLSEGNAQVCVTTHSPHFVGGRSFEAVRLVRKQANAASVAHAGFAQLAARYAEADEAVERPPTAAAAQFNEALRSYINEMFFARRVVLVEGSEDAAYIMVWLVLTNRMTAFRSAGLHVVPVEGKSNLARPLLMAQALGIPVFVVFDGDLSRREDNRHQGDNRRILRILGLPGADLFPAQTAWHPGCVQWCEDIATDVDAELKQSLGDLAFEAVMNEARAECGNAPSLGKNTFFLQHKLTKARERGGASATLDRLCEAILA